jgi:hypothetical protein
LVEKSIHDKNDGEINVFAAPRPRPPPGKLPVAHPLLREHHGVDVDVFFDAVVVGRCSGSWSDGRVGSGAVDGEVVVPGLVQFGLREKQVK